MAIFHLSHSFVKRSNGASSVAKAAYNAGQKIEDGHGSTAFSDYSRKGGILYSEITLPTGSPPWANNRGLLWRGLEAREDKSTRRASAILAHNFDIALPHELTLEQQIFLVKDFVREQFTRKGYAVDWSIHAPDPRGDDRNFHVHILVPLRKIEGESFGKKDRYNRQQLSQKITGLRKSWATLANRHLNRNGKTVTIDERSLRAQELKRKATKHHGTRSKAKASSFDSTRTTYPRSPIMNISKASGSNGSIKISAVISHSALNNIGSPTSPAPIFPHRPDGKGWPAAALRDWEAWGKRNPPRFFQVWSELTT